MNKISHPRRLNRAAQTLLAAVALIVGGLTFGAGAASAANGGYAMCADQSPVVGVWVNVAGGTSGWATRYGSGYQQRWAYNTQGRSYSLTVGCGGTPQRWAASTSTPYYGAWSNVTCFPGYSYGYGSSYVANRCYNG